MGTHLQTRGQAPPRVGTQIPPHAHPQGDSSKILLQRLKSTWIHLWSSYFGTNSCATLLRLSLAHSLLLNKAWFWESGQESSIYSRSDAEFLRAIPGNSPVMLSAPREGFIHKRTGQDWLKGETNLWSARLQMEDNLGIMGIISGSSKSLLLTLP